jgi:hypothetical protein
LFGREKFALLTRKFEVAVGYGVGGLLVPFSGDAWKEGTPLS